MRGAKPMLRAAAAAAAAGGAAATAWELALLAAAARARPEPDAAGDTRFVVLVPAHDEQQVLPGTLAAFDALDYPRERHEIVVIADNCTDGTARIARDHGATVWERTAPERRGKGEALRWALDRVLRERAAADAVVLVDADCLPSRNVLRVLDRLIAGGVRAAQVDYVVANPAEAGLRFAAFALTNSVRPAGKWRLGMSAGLLGTGMAFALDLVRERPWSASSLAEDREYHLALVAAGERVAFSRAARIRSPMPTSRAAARTQELRWEGGKLRLARDGVAPALAAALRRGDALAAVAALDEVFPPRSLLVAALVAAALAGLALRSRATVALVALSGAGQTAFVMGGLRLVRAPASAYRALAGAPGMVAHKLRLFGALAREDAPSEWVVTPRAPAADAMGDGRPDQPHAERQPLD